MKRIKLVGLFSVIVFAVSATMSTGAQAVPTYFKCVKKKGGDWNAECKGPEVPGAGKDERETAVGTTYTSKTKVAKLAVPAIAAEVSCKKSTDKGKITGEFSSEDVITFSSCKDEEGKSCRSVGQVAGVIVTNPLETDLVESAAGKAGIKITAKGGAASILADFQCEGDEGRVTGFTVGTIVKPEVGRATKAWEVVFENEMNLLTEVNIGAGFVGPFPAEFNARVVLDYGAEVGVEL